MADSSAAISSWAGGGATTTLGAAQGLYGYYQQSKNKRPEYKIPAEILANMTQAEQMALQGMPEEQIQQYINDIQRSQSYAISQASSRKSGLTGLATINQQGIDAYGDMLSKNAQAKIDNKKLAMQQRNILADYKDQEFQLNKLNPYYEKTAQNQALIGAGMQNVSQGLQSGNTGSVDWGSSRKPTEEEIKKSDTDKYYSDLDKVSGFNSRQDEEGLSGRQAYGKRRKDSEIYNYAYGGTVGDEGYGAAAATRQSNYAQEDQYAKLDPTGSTNLFNSIGRPEREKNEAIDTETGQLKNYKQHQTIGGGLLNPLAALQTRGTYKGGYGDIDGSKYKQHLIDSAQPAFQAHLKQKEKEQQAKTLSAYQNILEESKLNQGETSAPGFAKGGLVSKKKLINIEKKEVVKNKDNSVYVANAPSHKEGGKTIVADKGAKVFSDKITVPGLSVTFAKQAKALKNNPNEMDKLFTVQEKYKKSIGLA